MSITEHHRCPMCNQSVGRTTKRDILKWEPEKRLLSGRGQMIHFTPLQSKMFDMLWRHKGTATSIPRERMNDALYSDQPNPSMATNCATQLKKAINKKLALVDMVIDARLASNYNGYRLIDKRIRK